MFPLVLCLAALGPPQPADHAAANPVYAGMLEPGVVVGPDLRVKLPPPAMPDGLGVAGQKAAILRVIGTDHSYEEFTRRSVVAPQVLRISDAEPSDPADPARRVDVYFIAHGDLRAAGDGTFLGKLTTLGKGAGGSVRGLTRDDLVARKIEPTPGAGEREGYGRVEFDILGKVRLAVTGCGMWSETAESVVAAGGADPRFRGDPEFPSEWRPLAKGAGGHQPGPPQPYGGAGVYLKVTRLTEPAGALFIEQHLVFAEPSGWFGGGNLLRSKLPLVVRAACCGCRAGWPAGSGAASGRRP